MYRVLDSANSDSEDLEVGQIEHIGFADLEHRYTKPGGSGGRGEEIDLHRELPCPIRRRTHASRID